MPEKFIEVLADGSGERHTQGTRWLNPTGQKVTLKIHFPDRGKAKEWGDATWREPDIRQFVIEPGAEIVLPSWADFAIASWVCNSPDCMGRKMYCRDDAHRASGHHETIGGLGPMLRRADAEVAVHPAIESAARPAPAVGTPTGQDDRLLAAARARKAAP